MGVVREGTGAAEAAIPSICCSTSARKGKESDNHPEGGVSGEDDLSDTSQETTDPHVLCEYCREIEFDPDKEYSQRLLTGDYSDWELGTLARIKQSQCRFCKLVELAYIPGNSPEARDEAESATVFIYWFPYDSGGRRALAPVIPVQGEDMNYICLAAVPSLNPDHVDSPRPYCYLRPVRSANIDLGFISDCLSKCSAQHGLECNPRYNDPGFPGLDFLRVIDVNRSCVVEAPLNSRYVALSYVWGGTPCYKLTTTNEASLSQDGALESMVDDLTLPRTISDAMVLVRGLGVQYLWVDALCLIQDDAEDLAAGIAVMDDIYERSWFTIIATGGKDASFGLPGVQSGSRSAEKLSHEIMPGLHLGIDITIESSLKYSVYNTRAWTLQEQLLSRRSLFFADDRVVFRCRQSEHSEDHADAFGSGERTNNMFSVLTTAIDMGYPMCDYSIIIFYYSQRNLTNSGDALGAMEGLIRRFSDKMKCQFFQGLPTAAFDGFRLFSSMFDIIERRSCFPSYSWAGWRGEISFDDVNDIFLHRDQMNEWLATKTWIIWYKRSTNNETSLVWDVARETSFPVEDKKYIGYRSRRPFQPPPFVEVDSSRTDPSEEFSQDPTTRSLRGYSLLQFWTLAVYFRIDYQSRHERFQGWRALVGSDLSACGYIVMDGYSDNDSFFQSDGPFEFVLLSEVPDENKYYVMLLEPKDGIVERRGFGMIDLDFVHLSLGPGAVWKEILLG